MLGFHISVFSASLFCIFFFSFCGIGRLVRAPCHDEDGANQITTHPFERKNMSYREHRSTYIGGSQAASGVPTLSRTSIPFTIVLTAIIYKEDSQLSCIWTDQEWWFSHAVPLSIYAFTLPLPYIGVPSTLPPGFVAGAVVLTAGLLLYSLPQAQHSRNSCHNRND